MGRATVEIEVMNGLDRASAEAGHAKPEDVRSAKLNALVDTGATLLLLPHDTIQQLGVPEVRRGRSRLPDGRTVEHRIYGPIWLKVMERGAIVEAASFPGNVTPLLGQFPLELLDYHVDPKGQRLIPNPESPDMVLLDLY